MLQRYGPVAYEVQLLEYFLIVHNVFHVSSWINALQIPKQTINTSSVNLEQDLTYAEYPIRVLDQKDWVTRKQVLRFYKVQWNQHYEDEATWESEEYLVKHFLKFLASCKP